MSNLEANKQVVRNFIKALGELDMERLLSFLAPDVKFETTGHHAASGVKTKAQLAKELPAIREMLPNGIVFTSIDDRGG